MKKEARRYAQIFFEALQETPQRDREAILQGFADLLRDRGRLSLYGEIEPILKKKLLEAEGVVEAEILVTRADAFSANLENKAKEIAGRRGIDISLTIEPSLIGGFVMKIGDYQIDASLRTRLRNLNKILQA